MLKLIASGPIPVALSLALLAAPASQAAVESRAQMVTEVQIVGQPKRVIGDPDHQGFRRLPGFGVETSVENFMSFTPPSGNPVAATARGDYRLADGRVFMQLLSTADSGQPGGYDGAVSSVNVVGYTQITGVITGVPGAVGMLTLSGSFAASVGALAVGEWSSKAEVLMSATVQVSRPGFSGCPYARCLAQEALRGTFENGAYPLDFSKRVNLSQEVRTGDTFTLMFMAGGFASNGYLVSMGGGLASPLGGLSALSASAASADALAGMNGIDGLTLSNGLGFSADSGLVQRFDGSWGIPISAVPEAPAWLLMGAGLLALFSRRQRAA